MTWTYSLTAPQATKDQVRLMVGDTNTSDQQLQDEEITTLITLNCGVTSGYVNIYRVAADACDQIASTYGRQVTQSLGSTVSMNLSDRIKAFLAQALRFRALARRTGAVPYAGGLTESDKLTAEQDTDRVAPFFTRDMLALPGGPSEASPVLDQNSLNLIGR